VLHRLLAGLAASAMAALAALAAPSQVLDTRLGDGGLV